MKNILRELSKKEELIPDDHDGSYELVRETVKALKTVDETDLGIADLNPPFIFHCRHIFKGIPY